MNNVKKICGTPGIGYLGTRGKNGPGGYNILYDKELIKKHIDGSSNLIIKNELSATSSYFTINIEISSADVIDDKNIRANIIIKKTVASSENNTEEQNDISYICNNVNIEKNSYKNYVINNILDASNNHINIEFNRNSLVKLEISSADGTNNFKCEKLSFNIADEELFILDVIHVNSGDYIIGQNNNIYKVYKKLAVDGSETLNFSLISNSPNLNFFNDINENIVTPYNILLQDSLYSIDEIYDNDLQNNNLILTSNNEYIKFIDTSCNICYDNNYDCFSLVSNKAETNILSNDIYVNENSNILNYYMGYDIPNIINVDSSYLYINDLDIEKRQNLLITDISNNIIKDFNDDNIKCELIDGNSSLFKLYYAYQYNNERFLNKMYYYPNDVRITDCKCEVADNIYYNNFNIDIECNFYEKVDSIDISVKFSKDVSYNGNEKNEHIFRLDISNNKSIELTEKIGIRKDDDSDYEERQLHFRIIVNYIEIKHTNKIEIHDPSVGYLAYSNLDYGVPSNCILMAFDIKCIDTSVDTGVDVDISIDYKAYTNESSNIINWGYAFDISKASGIEQFVSSTHIDTSTQNMKMGTTKTIFLFFDLCKGRFISRRIKIDRIDVNLNINVPGESITTYKKTTFVCPVLPVIATHSSNHTYNKDTNPYGTFNRVMYNYANIYNGNYNTSYTKLFSGIEIKSFDGSDISNYVPGRYKSYCKKRLDTPDSKLLKIKYDISTSSSNNSILIPYYFSFNRHAINAPTHTTGAPTHAIVQPDDFLDDEFTISINNISYKYIRVNKEKYENPINLTCIFNVEKYQKIESADISSNALILTNNYDDKIIFDDANFDISIANVKYNLTDGASIYNFIDSYDIKAVTATNKLLYACYHKFNGEYIKYVPATQEGIILILEQPQLGSNTWNSTNRYPVFPTQINAN